jgi:hypothetical protein
MLQELIKDLQSSLKSYSLGLAKQNLLVDIPWTMVDGDLNLQRLIFRKDNSLYIVKEGEIQESKWEYLPAMNSLVIEIGGKKILMNEVFADGKALILKRDGVSMDFLSFANQNELPDLNLIQHLQNVRIEGDTSFNKLEDQSKSEVDGGVIGTVLIVFLVLFVFVMLILDNSPNS